MTYAIVYNSMTGNTAYLAYRINIILGNIDCIYNGPNSSKALDADVIYVGFWTNMSICDDKTKEFLQTLTNQKIVLFGTAGFMSEDYEATIINNIKSILPEGVEVVGSFMCQGKMQDRVLQRYLKAKEEGNPKADGWIKNFHEAKNHPDQKDLSRLGRVVAKANGIPCEDERD